ncbi:ribbon-helix-helix domain-containing protein [Rubellicoccus peritrichatus]|uniref:Ribbon-helix-helix domain-containing protein n=1 Tax=Rubellicoccus peritrichatus TaxID=3080537 RepID=A0AAQ3LEF6_9BACT|nr:ribbon-helix-helix domain-containing protein [Puniceicoccus sp. CR14]WOO40410.1 ribbon-helix-helix domain-containing protein [Puniceicoccus sp. CR14]WOO40459.1 ribbon-helix-helix domain-containing protein [Puniceicoccus sp. CR14]WOO40508.1 ribbon-helix-helix domain-containing protein [Puniceicoccus sp. CR14]WOO40558.1 ribbon-helix-helix domain-containing protein [Puniceicoccus sp. CR14]
MGDERQRTCIVLPENLIKRIDKFVAQKNLSNRSEALEKALEEILPEEDETKLNEAE